MKKIIFANDLHRKKYEALLKRFPKEKLTPENLAAIYLIAWIETMKPDIADQILDFKNFSINLFATMLDWNNKRTQNAILLAFHLKMNHYDIALDIIEASKCHRVFLEALYICYDICYADIADQLDKTTIQYQNRINERWKHGAWMFL